MNLDKDNFSKKIEIKSILDMIKIVGAPYKYLESILEDHNEKKTPLGITSSNFPRPLSFGLWFRGQSNAQYKLIPSAFRSDDGQLDERNAFSDLKLRLLDLDTRHRTSFELLCILRHNILPARILDWSESPLTALYFAVQDAIKGKSSSDGVVTCINAYHLNEQSSVTHFEKPGMRYPRHFDVLYRSAMAEHHYFEDVNASINGDIKGNVVDIDNNTDILFNTLIKNNFDPNPSRKKDFEEKITMPVAVVPKRDHPRMVAQLSTFTVHGGKIYFDGLNPEKDSNEGKVMTPITPPKNLDEINNSLETKKFMVHFIVRHEAKARILDELDRLSVNAAMLFPEFEHQSAYVKERWSSRGETIQDYDYACKHA